MLLASGEKVPSDLWQNEEVVIAQQEGKGRLSSFEEGKVRGGKGREWSFAGPAHVVGKDTCFPRLLVVVEEVVPLSLLLRYIPGRDPVGPLRWSSILMMASRHTSL